MFEKVNPSHPDKIADRIAGAIVDLAYNKQEDPKIAVEVLIGHNRCNIIAETSVEFDIEEIEKTVRRISKNDNIIVDFISVPQDKILAKNQEEKIKCGDNGIFRGVPITLEEQALMRIANFIYTKYPTDGKYILSSVDKRLIICQSNANHEDLSKNFPDAEINPLGDWTGGINVDCGATNRKLGSDMGQSVTGGGLHGKDLSKADVSVNIYVWLKAQEINKVIDAHCAIGDEIIGGIPFEDMVESARNYIKVVGGFEKFAEWGLIRPYE